MDTRNGNLYHSRFAALADGVPEESIAIVDTTHEGGVIVICQQRNSKERLRLIAKISRDVADPQPPIR